MERFNVFIVVVALMTSVYVGWVLDIHTVVEHIGDGSEGFNKPFLGVKPSTAFVIMLKYVIPVVILLVLLNMIGLLGMFSGA